MFSIHFYTLSLSIVARIIISRFLVSPNFRKRVALFVALGSIIECLLLNYGLLMELYICLSCQVSQIPAVNCGAKQGNCQCRT